MAAKREIKIDVQACSACGKPHVDLPAIERDKPADKDGSNFAAVCPETQVEIPVWHSGFQG